MTMLRVAPIAVALVTLVACGNGGPDEGGPTLIREFTAMPIDAGAHPDAFAYQIEAIVLTGSNPCVAANSDIRFQRRRDDGTMFVTATREIIDPNLVCTTENDPVYEQITTDVRGYRGDPAMVMIENVGEMGRQQPLW